MWVAIGHSETGTSHVSVGVPCQDFHAYFNARLGGENVLLIGIADGAGSAAAARMGAEECVRYLLKTAAESEVSVTDITEDLARNWFIDARQHLEVLTAREGITLRDLSCTLMLAVLGENGGAFAQIGDGAWIAEYCGDCKAVTWPTAGEHANETVFITSAGWEKYFQFCQWREPMMNVAGFTDGLERLGLHFAAKAVHAPFFEGMFAGLSAALADHADLQDFAVPLISFLQSPDVNQRTDDDKTLVVACRRKLALCDAPSE